MTEQTPRVICIGEAVIELRRGPDGAFSAACAGDSFNTAVYLARAGLNVGFATAVGDDPYSDSIVALALAEGLGADLILRVPGRLPALSLVEHGQSGKSVSRVWGDGAPARELFELTDWMRIAHSLISARLIYFSGITLSLYSNDGLGRLFAALEVARQQGAKVAFDGNFRPAGWKGNLARTRTVFMEALKRVDIALRVGEIVVKNGPNSALVATSRGLEFVPVPEILVPVDPTAAGDGFNAGYLAARLSGTEPAQAASAAHQLAGNIISHPGALLPRAEAAMH